MEDYTNEQKKKSWKKVLKMIVNKIIHPNIISLIVVAVIVGGLFFFIGKVSNSKAEPEHKEVVTQLSLKDIGTLSTQEAYVTVVEAMDENRKLYDAEDAPDVPLTNSVCVFSHDFQITAGYDFERIKPKVEQKTDNQKGVITVPLPDAKILTSGMLSDKEEVYYEKESIFNNLSEAKKAELRAEMGDKAENIAVENGLLDKAKSNAKKVLKNFIYNIYDSNDYDIVFEDVKE